MEINIGRQHGKVTSFMGMATVEACMNIVDRNAILQTKDVFFLKLFKY